MKLSMMNKGQLRVDDDLIIEDDDEYENNNTK
jgi:hypothetical protein